MGFRQRRIVEGAAAAVEIHQLEPRKHARRPLQLSITRSERPHDAVDARLARVPSRGSHLAKRAIQRVRRLQDVMMVPPGPRRRPRAQHGVSRLVERPLGREEHRVIRSRGQRAARRKDQQSGQLGRNLSQVFEVRTDLDDVASRVVVKDHNGISDVLGSGVLRFCGSF